MGLAVNIDKKNPHTQTHTHTQISSHVWVQEAYVPHSSSLVCVVIYSEKVKLRHLISRLQLIWMDVRL